MANEAERALEAWAWASSPELHEADGGLINQTFVVVVEGTATAVLQQLNTRIFAPEVHEDIEAVTCRLEERGVATPRLLRTRAGGLWHTDGDGGVWRCLSHLGTRTVHKVQEPALAREAGVLVARFHAAVADLDWHFKSVRAGAHDTKAHMGRLEEALGVHRGHRLYDRIAPLGEEILERWGRWTGSTTLPKRVIHGDLKISNVRFDGERAVCLIDLDTMARDVFDAEIGDAMRSWCNPASEDAVDTTFDLAVFRAAMQGYAAGARTTGGPTEAEWASVVPGIERICLELASRFGRDALEEAYFGWNPAYGTRGDHNLLRASGQLALARSVRAYAVEAEAVVKAAQSS